MNATVPLALSPHAALALDAYLSAAPGGLTSCEVASLAIEAWLAAHTPAPGASSARRGYQWKTLFLPDQTRLRMCACGQTGYATVQGDAIMYAGRRCSPRQLTLALAGSGRNALRELWICFPGQSNWTQAARLRTGPAPAPAAAPSPAETINAAAACMAQALQSALTLVGQVSQGAAQQAERRRAGSRRGADLLADSCALD
ncbi:MAG: hypothetical protein V4508_18635 [Pseudomonadota bacterium]